MICTPVRGCCYSSLRISRAGTPVGHAGPRSGRVLCASRRTKAKCSHPGREKKRAGLCRSMQVANAHGLRHEQVLKFLRHALARAVVLAAVSPSRLSRP
eukprot:1764363-Pleurochrysis_carterae.AAC.1